MPSKNESNHTQTRGLLKSYLFSPIGISTFAFFILVYPFLPNLTPLRSIPTNEIRRPVQVLHESKLPDHIKEAFYFMSVKECEISVDELGSHERIRTKMVQGTIKDLISLDEFGELKLIMRYDTVANNLKHIHVKSSGNKIVITAEFTNSQAKLQKEYEAEIFLPVVLNPYRMKTRIKGQTLYINTEPFILASPFRTMVSILN